MEKTKAPCPHTSYVQERQGQFHTGDYICTLCGEVLTPADVEKIKERRKQSE
jgi:hypothetical protein